MVTIEHLRKEFSYTNPDANHGSDDMWFDYVLGLLGKRSSRTAARCASTVAVDDISLEIDNGEFFGLLGPNGAGKTTLIKMLATILRPDSGRIIINGHDTVRDTAKSWASLNVVAASGWFAFDMQLTLRQNLVFWGRLCGLDRHLSDVRARAALDVVNLSEWGDETPDHLSSAMRQRLALAKGLLVHSPVFLLDEPTANVDPLIGYQIRDFLRNTLNRELGQTIILATHNMVEAEHICDRVAIVNQGRILVCDRPGNLTQALNGRIVEISLTERAAATIARLRDSGLTQQLADTRNETDSGRVRVHLASHATRAGLQAIVPLTASVTDSPPTLADVFVHHAGRPLHVNHDIHAAA
jgi:ABC-2 type transport system ATP-binding protein